MNDQQQRPKTRQQCIDEAGYALALSDHLCAQMTPREQAEAAWTPTCDVTVDELEDEIRADRGLPPLVRDGQGPS